MLNSVEWTTLRILEHELTVLEIKGKKEKVRNWMIKRISELKAKDGKK
jgi:hypothetical protein